MKAVIIPDVHQNIFFVEQILKKEEYDHLYFLGDFFDSFFEYPKVLGVRAVAKFMNQFVNHSNVTILVGNHDISYYEEVFASRYPSRTWTSGKRFPCQGYSRTKAKKICKEIDHNFVKNCRIAAIEQGYVLSHAGFHPRLIGRLTPEELVAKVNCAWERFPWFLENEKWIDQRGHARGGEAHLIGGPLWLDWFEEFEETWFPQIVGHTNNPSPRKQGDSYMLDAGQRVYGVLENEQLTIKSAWDDTLSDISYKAK